jgi:hypothetical protein
MSSSSVKEGGLFHSMAAQKMYEMPKLVVMSTDSSHPPRSRCSSPKPKSPPSHIQLPKTVDNDSVYWAMHFLFRQRQDYHPPPQTVSKTVEMFLGADVELTVMKRTEANILVTVTVRLSLSNSLSCNTASLNEFNNNCLCMDNCCLSLTSFSV